MRRNNRSAADDQGAIEGLVGDVGNVHHHAQAVHLVHHIFAEVAQTVFGVRNLGIIDITRRIGPTVGVAPGERHVAHAEPVIVAQQAQAVFDGMAALDPHQRRQLMLAMGGPNVFR